jgi:hypothetical protein
MLAALKEYYLEKMTPINSPCFDHPVELDDTFVWQIQYNNLILVTYHVLYHVL